MADIFISYSRNDAKEATILVDELRLNGYSVWIDHAGIHGASNWTTEIVEALDSCSTVIFLISPDSVNSENVAREIHLASEKKKHLLPVVITEVELPVNFQYPLAGLQKVRFKDTGAIHNALQNLIQKSDTREPIKQIQSKKTTDDGFIHLAVLPFDDLSPQHDNEWFADGMMDELISTLGSLKKLRVPSRTDVLYYRKHHVKAKDIADDLGVRYLVEGSVRKAGDKIRITASLMDTVAKHQLWTNKFDGSFDDIFDFQDSVSLAIVAALKLKLTPEEEEKVLADPTQNAEAYELYLKAVGYQHHYSRKGYENSLLLLAEALDLDPDFCDAFISRSYAYASLYREYLRDPQLLQESESAIESAEKISGITAMTLRARSEIAMLNEDYQLAEKLLEQAIGLEPGYKELYNLLGNIYLNLRKFPEAVSAFEKVLSFKEDMISYYNLLVALSQQERTSSFTIVAENAVICCEKHIRRNPDEIFPKLVNAYSLFWAGRITDARKEAEQLLTHSHHDATTLYNLGSLFDELGDPEMNLRLISRSITAGFRQIELLLNLKNEDPTYHKELESLIAELESLIRKEKLGDITT